SGLNAKHYQCSVGRSLVRDCPALLSVVDRYGQANAPLHGSEMLARNGFDIRNVTPIKPRIPSVWIGDHVGKPLRRQRAFGPIHPAERWNAALVQTQAGRVKHIIRAVDGQTKE